MLGSLSGHHGFWKLPMKPRLYQKAYRRSADQIQQDHTTIGYHNTIILRRFLLCDLTSKLPGTYKNDGFGSSIVEGKGQLK